MIRTALVTGAGKRIGRAIALDMAAHGWDVAVHYGSSETEADGVAAEIRAMGRRAITAHADLEDAASVLRLVPECAGRLGPLTCVVNNASLFIEDDVATLDPAVWDRQLAVNLRAPVLLAQALANHLPPDCFGNVVNIIDQRVLRPTPDFLSYSIAKEALHAATRRLAQALAPRIRVNGIGPGPVLQSVYQTDAAFEAEARGTLLRRVTGPAEIAQGVRFILDAPSLTGQMIALDAGQHLVWTCA
ncbi:MAG: SDR family oxidoreductase [Hyphomicrobiaceae bacterium]|nr:SDR family oxidoreductase [Hyphomicrobiaceae bacterium]